MTELITIHIGGSIFYERATDGHNVMIKYVIPVPRCRTWAGGRPWRVPARGTAGWCRGSWWSQRGSLQAEKRPWSRTSRTASAALRPASPRPRSGRCQPRSGTSQQASAADRQWGKAALNLSFYRSSWKSLDHRSTPGHACLYSHETREVCWIM